MSGEPGSFPNTALVTGGAGFIGSTLVDELISRGCRVVVVDDLSRGRRDQVSPMAIFEHLDITSSAFVDCVARHRPDVIFHQAAQIDVRRSMREPLLDTTINVVGTVNVLEAAVRAEVGRVVLASSGGAVYGDGAPLPTPESTSCHPDSVYGAAKRCTEIYGELYWRQHGLVVVSLRYANVYGPRQDPHGEAGVVAIFSERLLRGEPTVIFGDGGQTRDYVFVDDVVRANILAAGDVPTGCYNVGTGVETDVNVLHGWIAALCGVPNQPRHDPPKPGEQMRSCLSIGQAADVLGWEPAIDLASGLERTVRWFAQTQTDRAAAVQH